MEKPRVYLDNCCFNSPFDDQNQLKVRLESEAKLYIQSQIKEGNLILVWSFVLDYEIGKTPAIDRRTPIKKWEDLAINTVPPLSEIESRALELEGLGFNPMDALHLASSIYSKCEYFFTTDKGILKRRALISDVKILNPVEYIENEEENYD